jgi:hypothetical protein
MRAPLISLWVSAAGLVAAGCASSPPQEERPVASVDRSCSGEASNPLHLTSNKTVAERGDPEIESILTQRGDPRLVWINRRMYQSLHALDVELRREQRIAGCERAQSGSLALEAQAGADAKGSAGSAASGTGAGGGALQSDAAQGGGAAALVTADVTTTAAAATQNAGTNGAAVTPMSAVSSRSALIRKSSLSSAGGGGNGATMPKVIAGSDNDIVARRLRKAAEQETDPTLRKRLWKEYADYQHGLAAK